MKEGPDIARIAALIGDPGRANMLTALMSGKALTASELAQEAGITLATASGHLSKLSDAGLLRPAKQGRHKYFALASDDVASALEGLMGLASQLGQTRVRTGPKDGELRKARVCYNHLAGDIGTALLDAMGSQGLLQLDEGAPTPSDAGRAFFEDFGISLAELEKSRTPVCRYCLDWSTRRDHLAGSLGRAILSRIFELKWAERVEGTRIIRFVANGEQKLRSKFGIQI